MNLDEIIAEAKKELEEEQKRSLIEAYKLKLRKKKWWHKIMPYKIVLIKREKL